MRAAARWLGTRIANPLLSIEIASAFRRVRFLVAFTLSLLVLVTILILVIAANVDERPATIGQYVFIAFTTTIGFVSVLMFPAFSCTSIVEEKVNRSLDLLLVTRLQPWEIFAGKLMGALIYCAMFLVGTLPVVALSFLLGGVEPGSILAAYAQAGLVALLICTLGTYASAASPTIVRAIIVSYVLTIVIGALVSTAALPITLRWSAPAMGAFSSHESAAIEQLFANGGDLIHGGFAFVFLSTILFFSLAGTNRLKPPAYDRSTSMRAFAVIAIGGLAVLFALAIRRILAVVNNPADDDLYVVEIAALCCAAALLFLPVLVFSTERPEISRRVELEIRSRFRLSPLRLLAPGPARGAAFATALAAAVLLGLAYEAARGIGLAGLAYPGIRNDVAHRDLAVVLACFLAFLAAFGRLLAEYAAGTVAPRLAVAGLAVVLVLGPMLTLVADHDGRVRNGTEDADPGGVPSALARGYILSPILAGFSAVSAEYGPGERTRYFLSPAAYDVGADELALASARPYSTTPVAAAERRAIPLHRASSALYLSLAAACWVLAARRARRRAREAGAP